MAGWTGATVQGVTQDRETTRLDLGDRLGGGALGEVWRARDAHGQPVVLRRVGRVEAADLREVRRLATVVRALPTPHLVRLRRCLGDEDDRMLLLDPAASSLTDLLAARGRLRSGEVVTVVAPLAEALGHAHAHGLAHGRVGLGSVLFTADGMPLLDGLGLEPLRRPAERLDVGDPALAVDDVRALGRLCGELVAWQPGASVLPGELAEVITGCLGDDPPLARDLAAALLAACRAEPLTGLPRPAAPPVHRRRHLRPLGPVAAAAAALLLVVAAGWAWGSGGGEAVQVTAVRGSGAQVPGAQVSGVQVPGAQVPAPRVVRPDWRAVMDGLDAQRATAFATADPSALQQVWAVGASALARDLASVAALRAARRTARGVRHVVSAAVPLVVGTDRVELAVVQRLGPQRVLEGARVVSLWSGGTDVRCRVVLVRGPGGWRVAEVQPL